MKSPRPIPPLVSDARAHAPLRAGADPGFEDKYGHTALHSAAEGGRLAVALQHMLAAGGDPNGADSCGRTPMHLAAGAAQVDLLRRLLAAGGDPNVQDDYDSTPLHNAAWRCRPAAVQILLAAGADPTILNHERSSPLVAALRRRSWDDPRPLPTAKVVDLLVAAVRQHYVAGTQ